MPHLLIIGGSDAGISAALRARELDSSVDVTVVVADAFPNYSICGLPFLFSGEVTDWRQLAHRTAEEITREGIRLLLNHMAQSIDPIQKTVQVVDQAGEIQQLQYDRLIIATGAVPIRPKIEGVDLPGVYFLRSMADSFALERHLTTRKPLSAVIIGGGYIGLEMADALTLRGLAVTVLDRSKSILKTVEASFGWIVSAELQRHRVEVIPGVSVEKIEFDGKHLRVMGSPVLQELTDLVLIATGVQPSVELAQTAGLKTGAGGAIQVNRNMETNVPGIYAAGDCVETYHRLLPQPVYLPLGTTAHKQGRIAGANAVGHTQEFAGTSGTQVLKVFDLAIARTGLLEHEALDAGFQPVTVETEAWDHKAYYPGAHKLRIRVTGDHRDGRLLGAQIIGHYQAEIAKRIDIFATALFHQMPIEDLSDLDLSYTPPLGSPWDAVQMAAQAWVKQFSKQEVLRHP